MSSPYFSPDLKKSAPFVSRSIQEVLSERFTNLFQGNLLGASENNVHTFSQERKRNAR